MLNHADYLSAIQKRCSRRKYADRQVEDKEIGRLQMAIAAYNEQSGLHMKLVIGSGGELFDGFESIEKHTLLLSTGTHDINILRK